MHEYRVTKYDPALRDANGAFHGDDWTAVSDVGRSYGGVRLTRQEYDKVERAHIEAALAFLKEGGLDSLRVESLETVEEHPTALHNGSILSIDQLGDVIGQILREELWCNLEGDEAFIHFGYDYYMYIGVPCPCPDSEVLAAGLGLFVEFFPPDLEAPQETERLESK
jgi:hypothetical protein